MQVTEETGSISPARLVEEAARLVSTSVSDIVPPQAQIHLLNAQRELLLAVAVTIEHNSSRISQRGTPAKRRSRRQRRAPSRVELD